MEVTAKWIPLLVLAGGAAGFVNVVAGGGSFFSFPLLILLGFPPVLANGTIRVSIVLQNLVAVPTYARQGFFFPRQALICSLVTVPAAIAGALTAVRLDPDPFRRVSAVLVVLVLATLFIQPKNWTRRDRLARIRWTPMLFGLAAVGFYGGFFQLGAGLPFLAVAVLAGGWDLVSANSLKVTVILVFTTIALIVFAAHGNVHWVAGIALGVGNMIGGWIGARSAVKRGPGWIRWVMVAMGVLAAIRLLATSGVSRAEAAPLSLPDAPISAALHVHGPFSEGNASMEWHTDHARRLGVDVIWWTEHDWRLENWGKTRRFDFEAATLASSGRAVEEPDEALADETRSWVVSGGMWPEHRIAVSAAEARAGSRSLEIRAVAPSLPPGFAYLRLAQNSSRKRHGYPLATRPHVRFSFLPAELDAANGKFFVEAVLSVHPDGQRTLRWVLGSLDEEPADTIPLTWTPGVWNDFDLDVAAAAIERFAAGADSIVALDNSLHEVRIGIANRAGHLPRVYFDEYAVDWDDTLDGAGVLRLQGGMARWFESVTPEVTQFVGTEISRWAPQPHLNAFTPGTFFPEYGAHGDQESPEWAVNQVHAAGGVVSLNHAYGSWIYPDPAETPEARQARLTNHQANLVRARALGVDVLEVGYRWRGGVSLIDLVETWDVLTANRVFVTGNGVSDSHGTDLFYGWAEHRPQYDYENNFVTWLWADEVSRAGMLRALRAGRVFFGDPFRFDGTLDLRTEDGFPMGRVVLVDGDTSEVQVVATGLPAGAFVRLIQFVVDETGGDAVLPTRRLRDESLGTREPDGSFFAAVSVATDVASAVRVEIGDGTESFVFSNPVVFLRQWPPQGVSAARVAVRRGELALRSASEFTVTAFEWNEGDAELILRGNETRPGQGRVVIDTGTRGSPVSVEGVTHWRASGGTLSLDGFQGTGSVATVRWGGDGAGALGVLAVGPNPFGADVTVDFTLAPRGIVRLDVVDVGGRLVRRLVDEALDAGTHRVTWDGRDARGGDVAAGVYFARLRADGRERVTKLVKLR